MQKTSENLDNESLLNVNDIGAKKKPHIIFRS